MKNKTKNMSQIDSFPSERQQVIGLTFFDKIFPMLLTKNHVVVFRLDNLKLL
jgi:hypothetical protein